MLARCPRPGALPPLPLILADLGDPSPAELAHALDVAPSTVRRWLAAGAAPLAATLALFWLTSWGRSQVECHAVNDARMLGQVVRSQADELVELRAELARVLQLADFGAANAPTMADQRGADAAGDGTHAATTEPPPIWRTSMLVACCTVNAPGAATMRAAPSWRMHSVRDGIGQARSSWQAPPAAATRHTQSAQVIRHPRSGTPPRGGP